ncbi:fructosamine kinase family protein [Spiribacter vilamensis]|uniref:Fructosamine-3-kinase n=1 Tax=Spiribacter vilamensis TaxID=531306 RepID=A0A4Q8D2K1_9GAMM|nr:fructosamine kinase family protein [Spiribacter vilamensis]RZU99626.1 fructosamine-3-kinase [Spiribacter vilamensis]TVO61416.1 fructosamine kinase family protein [Spiribacter vilamensis]
MDNACRTDIEQGIANALGSTPVALQWTPIGGGDINAAYRLEGGAAAWFVKLNRVDRLAMFEAEAEGLQAMAAADGPRVPSPLTWGVAGERSYLVMEWIELQSRGDAAALGAQLAGLHGTTAERHGWHRDNTIGATDQLNPPDHDWVRFYRDQRLRFQLALARRNGLGDRLQSRGEALADRMAGFFEGYTPVPSLLHGDLWGGNVAFDGRGQPVLYDPAVYFGDRESDIAMSELFGRLPTAAYDAYNAAYPLDAGYPVRRDLYQLYHVLNHANLFGGPYAREAESLIDRLLAQV